MIIENSDSCFTFKFKQSYFENRRLKIKNGWQKKRSGWTLKDELELLEKWEARSHDLWRAKQNAHIYNEISQEMAQKYTAEEIHCKVKNMTKKYREEKTKIGPFGGSPSPWSIIML